MVKSVRQSVSKLQILPRGYHLHPQRPLAVQFSIADQRISNARLPNQDWRKDEQTHRPSLIPVNLPILLVSTIRVSARRKALG